jgi:hypothetical protein
VGAHSNYNYNYKITHLESDAASVLSKSQRSAQATAELTAPLFALSPVTEQSSKK